MDILNRHGVKATLNYSGGGHEWSNWRSYFNNFVQLAFH
jgi:S-formylglutathione hydrolase FrmB